MLNCGDNLRIPVRSRVFCAASRGLALIFSINLSAVAFVWLLGESPALGARPIEIEWVREPTSITIDALALGPQGQVYVAGDSGTSAFLSKYDGDGVLSWTTTDYRATRGGIHALVAESGKIYSVGTAYAGIQSTAFISKYDESGHQEWFKSLGNTGHHTGFHAAAADASGNLFVAGTTNDDLVGPSSGYFDAVLARYGPDGTLLWAKQFGSILDDYIFGVDSDDHGNVYVTGSTHASLFGPNARGGSHQSFFSDTLVAKFDSAGVEVWSRQYGDPFSDMGTGIALDSNGNIFVSGHTGASRGGASAGGLDVFIEKLDSNGNRKWVKQFGTAETDWSFDVETDELGTIFLASNHFDDDKSTVDFDGLVRRFSPDGELLWDFNFATNSHDQAHDIAIDSTGSLFVTGYAGGEFFGSSAIRNGFLVKLHEIPELRSIELFLAALYCCAHVAARRSSRGFLP